MATQTYEQLIAGANKIKENELPESNTHDIVGEQLLQMTNKMQEESSNTTKAFTDLETDRVKKTTELNISHLYPTNGVGGTNKYTLTGAIAQVDSKYRNIQGLKVSFVNKDNDTETWEYNGGSWAVGSFGEVGVNKFAKLEKQIITVYEFEKLPFVYGKLMSSSGNIINNIWNSDGSVACKCLIINVSNVKKITYNKSFHVQNGGTVFLGESKDVLSFFDGQNKEVIVPEGAILAAINFPTEIDFNFELQFDKEIIDYTDNNFDPCIIDGLWDGNIYNYNWWGEGIAMPEIVLSLSANKVVNQIHMDGAYIFYNEGERNKLSSWGNTSGIFYLNSTENLIFELDDELIEDIDIYIYPKQVSWNNGAILTDKVGNIMPSLTRNSSFESFKAYSGTKKIQIKDPSNLFNGNVFLYTTSQPVTGLNLKSVTANRVLHNNIFSGSVILSENLIDATTLSRKQTGNDYSALFVDVLPDTTYYFFGSPSLVSNDNVISEYPLIECNSDRQVINKIDKNTITKFQKLSLLNSKVSSVYKFTTSSDTRFICFKAYASTVPINIEDIKIVICADYDIYNAIKLEDCNIGKTEVHSSFVSNVIKRLDKDIWLLGDSISGTGYGGVLSGIEGGGNGAWGKYFIDIIQPRSMYNYAAGGYSITDASTTFDEDGILQNTNASYIKMLEQAIADYQQGKISAPDYLIINGCTNDFGKTRINPDGWSERSFVTKEDLLSESLNPDNLDYDEFMEKTFITDTNATRFSTNILKDITEVPMFKIAGAIRYIVQRISVLFPNCKFIIISSIPAPSGWIDQKKCHTELKWIAERLSIPYVPVNEASNICLLNDMPKTDGGYGTPDNPDNPRRFIADGFHPYGAADSEGAGFITAGAMYQGKFIAEEFKRYCMPLSDKDIQVVDFRDSTSYPHEYNVDA